MRGWGGRQPVDKSPSSPVASILNFPFHQPCLFFWLLSCKQPDPTFGNHLFCKLLLRCPGQVRLEEGGIPKRWSGHFTASGLPSLHVSRLETQHEKHSCIFLLLKGDSFIPGGVCSSHFDSFDPCNFLGGRYYCHLPPLLLPFVQGE